MHVDLPAAFVLFRDTRRLQVSIQDAAQLRPDVEQLAVRQWGAGSYPL
jgi:hypothetical protein